MPKFVSCISLNEEESLAKLHTSDFGLSQDHASPCLKGPDIVLLGGSSDQWLQLDLSWDSL